MNGWYGWYGWYVGVGSLNLTQDRNHAHEITTWDFLRSEDPPESDGTDGPDLEPAHEEAKAQWTLGLAGLEGQDCSSATPKDWIVGLTVTNWSPKKGGHLDQVWSACAWFNTRSVETWDATNPIEQLILEQDRRYKSSSLIREYIRDKKCLGQSLHRNWWNEIYGSGIDGT
jgi:hypothetical protein